MTDLAGRTAIVTGGGRGIGRAVCELVAMVRAGGGEAISVAGSIADPATGAVVFVAAEGDSMTGTCVDVNGGLYM
jgi:NAD(P)-dependent dehydrogenase (short-subunit alcohol dehydrogenase family)